MEVSVMPDRAGPALLANLAPSLAGSSLVTDTFPVDWPVSSATVSDITVSDTAISDEAPDDWPADGWPTDDGPADEGPGPVVSWTGGVTIGQVLSAVDRYQRHRAGLDLPAWGEAGHAGKPDDQPAGDPGPGRPDDELTEEAVRAAPEGRGRVLSVAALGGHAIMAPGPDLAGWLACSQASERDDAALVTSITAWRKVTSWAQAQELAAVAELARRRRVAGAVVTHGEGANPAVAAGEEGRNPAVAADAEGRNPTAAADEEGGNSAASADAEGRNPTAAADEEGGNSAAAADAKGRDPAVAVGGDDRDPAVVAGRDDRGPMADAGGDDRDPVAELEAEFAQNEIALALTLTQGGAEYWMDLAVSLTRRLPATLAALGAGTIDLNRARLIDQHTSSLDHDLARAVERRV